MLALDLLHRALPHRVLRGREMPPIDTRLIGVIPGDTTGGEQSLEFQEHRISPGTHNIGEYSPGVMINRMPEPSLSRFGPNETPHFIELGGAIWLDVDGARTRRGTNTGLTC